MNPYYEHEGITIYHGDCREVLGQLERADAIVTDPPYGDTSLNWDRMVRGWMDTAETVTSSVWCFGSFRMFMEMARNGDTSRCRGILRRAGKRGKEYPRFIRFPGGRPPILFLSE